MNYIPLSNGFWKALVAPDFGMNTVSLVFREKAILRSPDEPESLEKDPCVYGIPLLLPPNRTDRGEFSFDGVDYHLPINEERFANHIHGSLCRAHFTVTQQTENSVCGYYENHGEIFPFPFRIEVYYVLKETGYYQTFLVRNIGAADMPLTFGLHTTFLEQGSFRVPIGQRWEQDNRYLPTGKLLPLNDEEQAYRTGTTFNRKQIRGYFTAAGHTAYIGNMQYDVSSKFDQWILWNGTGQQGFCSIEPLCGAVNALNSKQGLLRLTPGREVSFSTKLILQQTAEQRGGY